MSELNLNKDSISSSNIQDGNLQSQNIVTGIYILYVFQCFKILA